MKILSNVTGGRMDLDEEFTLHFSVPVRDYDSSRLTLFSSTDTITPSFFFSDSLQRKGIIDHPWKTEEVYRLVIEDSAFLDLGGSYNDSTGFGMKLRALEDYGTLIMNVIIPGSTGSYLIQLMSDKEVVLAEKQITASGPVRFEYLLPASYKLKAISDRNSNGKWDTGNYRTKSLPEQVEYYTPALSIRANWDLQEEWQLK
jgi:hypothetical protein